MWTISQWFRKEKKNLIFLHQWNLYVLLQKQRFTDVNKSHFKEYFSTAYLKKSNHGIWEPLPGIRTYFPRRQASCRPQLRKTQEAGRRRDRRAAFSFPLHSGPRPKCMACHKGLPQPGTASTGFWLPSNRTGMTSVKSPSFPSCHILSKAQSTARANRWTTVLSCVNLIQFIPRVPKKESRPAWPQTSPQPGNPSFLVLSVAAHPIGPSGKN